MLRTLVLGGTSFVGRHLAFALRARGHHVTLFNRGITAPDGIPDVPVIRGDREAPGGLDGLRGLTWDAVFDTSCYRPRVARATIAALGDVPQLVFVSSISVYADVTRLPIDEEAGVAPPPPDEDDLSLASYGGLKVLSERAYEEAWPGRVTHVRAGIIVGPNDYDDRFPWLLERVAAGGEMLAPGGPERPVQLVDARDLGAWMVRCAEERVAGTFNALGPDEPLAYGALLESMRRATGADTRFTWVPDEHLAAHGVKPYSEMPFWMPLLPNGPLTVSNARARAAGLRFRPADETIDDVWRWLGEPGTSEDRRRRRAARQLLVAAGILPEREHEILEAYRRRR